MILDISIMLVYCFRSTHVLTAFTGFYEEVFRYEGAMSTYDDFMVAKFAPGTVKASYSYIRRFVNYLLYVRAISLKLKEQVIILIIIAIIIMKTCF